MTQEESTRRFYAHVWPHRAMVLRSAHWMSGRAEDADDLAQETLMKAFRAIETFDEATHVQAWLMTILRHAHIDHIRGNARAAAHVSVDDLRMEIEDRHVSDADPQAHDLETLLEQLSDEQVIAGMRQLPAEICWSLLLVDVQQMTYDDAARVLAVPAGTVKSRVHRGRGMLRDELLRSAKSSHGAIIVTRDGGFTQ